jgi:hypothetical protein
VFTSNLESFAGMIFVTLGSLDNDPVRFFPPLPRSRLFDGIPYSASYRSSISSG